MEEIQKAFANAIQRSGISLAQVEEISVPTFGLDADARISRQIGDYTAEIQIAGSKDVEVRWLDAKGKELAGIPKIPKTQASEQKAAKQLASDIEKMLRAQSDRIENFLERDRSWDFSTWRGCYVDHPLLGPMSRRLIWHFQEGRNSESGIWWEDKFVQRNGRPIDWLSPKTTMRLWHPLGEPAAETVGWRRWLEEHMVTQPFKQAHREIYLLTEAELGTRTYSNRFAAHILRQHQFKALCDQRGWRYEFLGRWDSSESGAARDLAEWKLRAEFWIQPAGDELSPAGVALRVATDQVRFHDSDGREVELSEVPALVFSEVMRDVDLFVSVCSVGNDPEWADAGEGRERDYWREFSFGELNATAGTRREILERLLPKLKIAKQCSLLDRFLAVRGKLRNYKIHLGSANIKMEPNNQYLCIVPGPGHLEKGGDIFLPFEGDRILSIILSKAFMLADDDKITNPSILSQIKGR